MRGSRFSAVLLIVLVLTLLVVGTHGTNDRAAPPPAPAFVADSSPATISGIPAPSVVQTSTAGQTFYSTQTWNQTGTGLYAGHSTGWANFTVNPGGIITSVFTATATFAVTPPGSYVARVYVYQGTAVLANTTSDLFTVHPVVSSSLKMTERVLSVANATGGAPTKALYSVKTTVSESIQFDVVSTTGNWTYNNTTYRTHWYANSTNGYWLNSTTVSIPLIPGAVVNISSLSVTVNGSAATYQLATNAAYVLLGPVVPGASDQVKVSFRPVPTILAKPPVIYFGQFSVHEGLYTGQFFYFDYLVPAYNGLFVVHINETQTVTNLTLSANGHVFSSDEVAVNGNNVTLLPGSWTVYLVTEVLFMVTFNLAQLPQGFPADSIVLIGTSTSSVTLGDALLFAIVVSVAYVVLRAATLPGGPSRFLYRHTARDAVASIWAPVFLLVLLLILYFAGSLAT